MFASSARWREHRGARQVDGAAGVEEAREGLGVGAGEEGAGLRDAQHVEGELVGGLGLGAHDDQPGLAGARDHVVVEHVAGAGERLTDQDAGRPYLGDGRAVGDDQPGAGVGDHPGQLLDLGPRVHRDGHELGAQGGEVGRHELDAVAHGQQHPLARHHARVAQSGGHAVDLAVEIRPGQTASRGLHERVPAAVAGGCQRHQVGDQGGLEPPRRRGGDAVQGHPSMVPQGFVARRGTAQPR